MFADREADIIQWLQNIQEKEIYFIPEDDKSIECFETIYDKEKWLYWIDSSGKNAPPPDFFSDKYHLMMDVMRVDDHAFKNKKGKVVNPQLMHERELYKELLNSGILSSFRPDVKIFINGDSGLSSIVDHNYTFYYRNFNRVVKSHIDSIPLYKKNHPDYKIIFMIFDESTAYFQPSEIIDGKLIKGSIIKGRPHFAFLDRRFVGVAMNSGIDYLIWFTPYKKIDFSGKSLELPKVCVYDLSTNISDLIDYPENEVISCEE